MLATLISAGILACVALLGLGILHLINRAFRDL